ncbi:glycosyltransferase family 4 protein [Vibrio breoganii]
MTKLKVTFYSNFLNHHVLPLCKELDLICDFKFVASMPLPTEQSLLGYDNLNDIYDFVVKTYSGCDIEQRTAESLAVESDVVIHGSADFLYLRKRLALDKLTFKYAERIFKKQWYCYLNPKFISYFYKNYYKYKKNRFYLLSASYYASKDFNLMGMFRGKSYRWGYFPAVSKRPDYTSKSSSNSNIKIIWCGRFLKWKNPLFVVRLARYLADRNINFKIEMIGDGPEFNMIRSEVVKENLLPYIDLTGAVPVNIVRDKMLTSDICLFTSNKEEGWGAVLNEAMNSGCAVVASNEAGSVPYLINDGVNGIKYYNNNLNEFISCVFRLITSPNLRRSLSKNAIKTTVEEWEAKNAANLLLKLSTELLKNQCGVVSLSGPCSKI